MNKMQTLDTQIKRVISFGGYEAQSLEKKERFLISHYETNRSGLYKKLLRERFEQVQLQLI